MLLLYSGMCERAGGKALYCFYERLAVIPHLSSMHYLSALIFRNSDTASGTKGEMYTVEVFGWYSR